MCVLSKTLSGTYMLPVLLHADPYSICYLLSVTAVPCPALSLTLGCCKSNTRKQTSSNKHWRGVSCSVCFSTSHYHIMLLISHADSHRWHFVLGSNEGVVVLQCVPFICLAEWLWKGSVEKQTNNMLTVIPVASGKKAFVWPNSSRKSTILRYGAVVLIRRESLSQRENKIFIISQACHPVRESPFRAFSASFNQAVSATLLWRWLYRRNRTVHRENH